ncbi:hypothetical protein BJ508DRAFT_373006 [Ascobolus immersus RN42]|uniref:Uncharacterized protein n=1 Tax=Ascobolus immersus RN42 TaxID=1160509 RepID=A0A3N4IJB9_ASCIM|nr:hypothetical protein BJ508DRAFT_373006 [Ascobolus immersus RN42]
MSCLSFCFRSNPSSPTNRPQVRRAASSPVSIHRSSTPPPQVLKKAKNDTRLRDPSVSSVPSRCQSLGTAKSQSFYYEDDGKAKAVQLEDTARPRLGPRGGSCQSALGPGGVAAVKGAGVVKAGTKVQRLNESDEDVELTCASFQERSGMSRSSSAIGDNGQQGVSKRNQLPTIPARQQLRQSYCGCCGMSGGSCTTPITARSIRTTPDEEPLPRASFSSTYNIDYQNQIYQAPTNSSLFDWDRAAQTYPAFDQHQHHPSPLSSPPSSSSDYISTSSHQRRQFTSGNFNPSTGSIVSSTSHSSRASEYFDSTAELAATTTATATLLPGSTTRLLLLPAGGATTPGVYRAGHDDNLSLMGYGYGPQPVQVQVFYDTNLNATITASTATPGCHTDRDFNTYGSPTYTNSDLSSTSVGSAHGSRNPLHSANDGRAAHNIRNSCCSVSTSPASLEDAIDEADSMVETGAGNASGFHKYFNRGPADGTRSAAMPMQTTPPRRYHRPQHLILDQARSFAPSLTGPPTPVHRCPCLSAGCDNSHEACSSPYTVSSRDPTPPPEQSQHTSSPLDEPFQYKGRDPNLRRRQHQIFFHDGHGGGKYIPTYSAFDPSSTTSPHFSSPRLHQTTSVGPHSQSAGPHAHSTGHSPRVHESTLQKRDKRVQKVSEAARMALKRAVSADNTKAARAANKAALVEFESTESGYWDVKRSLDLEDANSDVDSWEEEERRGEEEEMMLKAERERIREEKLRMKDEKARVKARGEMEKLSWDGGGDGRRLSEDTVDDGEGHCTLDCDGENCHR